MGRRVSSCCRPCWLAAGAQQHAPNTPPPLALIQALGKRKLKWKRIAEHLQRKAKSCRKHYAKLTGKDAPEDDD